MRTLKFRAWNPVDMEMISDPLVYDSVGINDNFENFKRDEYYMMQFTGLTDKNGKDIYESDLLKSGRTGLIYRVEWDNDIGQEARFIARCTEPKKDFIMAPYSWGENEIIGNIYQNKDLLG